MPRKVTFCCYQLSQGQTDAAGNPLPLFQLDVLIEGSTFPVIKGNDGPLEEKIMKSIGGENILIIEEQR